MKTIVKEINLLDIEDIEEAISSHLGKKVSISDVDCSLAYCIPCDTEEPSGMYIAFTIGDKSLDSFDLFWDDDKGCHCLNGKRLCLDEPWLPVEEVFHFDTSAFKSFDSWTDSSD